MADQARRIEGLLLGFAGELIGQLQLRIYQSVSIATPVDTGHARSGWTPTVGSPAARRLPRPTNEAAARSEAKSRLAANLQRSRDLAAAYQVKAGRVFLANAVPYIGRLNEGYSAQAGAKFVEKAIDAGIRSLRTLKTLRRR